MFVKKGPPTKDGRIVLYYAEGFRDSNGKPRSRVIERIGYLNELEKTYSNPLAHFKEQAKIMTEEKEQENQRLSVDLSFHARMPFHEDTGVYDCVKNIGHAAISQVFHTLGIHQFLDDRRKYLKCDYNLTAVMKLLVYERILAPGSKRAAWLARGKYFDKMEFSLNDIYHSLSVFPEWREDLLQMLYDEPNELDQFAK